MPDRTSSAAQDRCDKCGTPKAQWAEKPCVKSLTQSPRHTITRFHIPIPEADRWLQDRGWHRSQMRTFAESLPDDLGPCFGRDVCLMLDDYDRLRAGLEELLDVAERIRGGDPKLNPEAWYAARDYAKVVLADAR